MNINLEGASVYAGMGNEMVGIEVSIALRVAATLSGLRIPINRTSLYDDTSLANHPNYATRPEDAFRSREFVQWRALSTFTQALLASSWSDTNILYENDFVSRGNEIIEALSQLPSPFRITDEGRGKYLVGSGLRIKIRGKSDVSHIPDFPSCQVLDTAIYERKLRQDSMAITILPESYIQQQTDTMNILKLLYPDRGLPVIVVYFGSDGQVTKVNSWSNELAGMQQILEANLGIIT